MTDAVVFMAFIITAEEPEIMLYVIENGRLRILELVPVSSVIIEPIE